MGTSRRCPSHRAKLPISHFREALNFVDSVGELAEAPTVSLRTKKIKGLHENDFIMAAKINGIFERAENG
jgi:4a-hydroxytetrahydrobiopterin dehydratase